MPDRVRDRAQRCARAGAQRCSLALLAACAPTQFEAQSDIPQPLIEKIPVVIGVHMPLEFTDKVYQEKREGAAASTASASARRSPQGSCGS